VHVIEDEQEFSYIEDDHLQFDSIQIDSCAMNSNDWMQKLRVNGKSVTLKLDTGAQANLIRLSDLKRAIVIKSTRAVLKDYNDQVIPVKGECVLDISYKARVYQLKFFVLDERNRQPILGRAARELLGLVKRVHSVQKEAEEIFEGYKELFQGLGCLPGNHSIDTDDCLTYSNGLSQSTICTS
jgi:hypothetical protein